MGLSREVVKALIIDSVAGWKRKDDGSHIVGYGIVPRRIEDILHSGNDEIRFIMTGTIDEYETYTYNIPVPQSMKAHPYFARATLAYFPKCDRNQGVDYTSTEMDIHFGRIIEKKEKQQLSRLIAISRRKTEWLLSMKKRRVKCIESGITSSILVKPLRKMQNQGKHMNLVCGDLVLRRKNDYNRKQVHAQPLVPYHSTIFLRKYLLMTKLNSHDSCNYTKEVFLNELKTKTSPNSS